MKVFIVLPIFLSFFLAVKSNASSTYKASSVCESFAAGEVDALKTLEALNLNIDDYSIGVNNTAKMFCA